MYIRRKKSKVVTSGDLGSYAVELLRHIHLFGSSSSIGKYSDENVPELRHTRSTFDGEYLEAHPRSFQAILPLETFHQSIHLQVSASDVAK